MIKHEVFKKDLIIDNNEKFLFIEELLTGLNKTDNEIIKIWEGEAQKRLDSYKKGKIETLSEEEFFSNVN